MSEQLTNPAEALIAADALTLFFYNYTQSDIAHLRQVSRAFDHAWKEYIDPKQDTFSQLWELWQSKFAAETRLLILQYAYQQQGEFARRKVEMMLMVREARAAQQEGGPTVD